MPDSTPRHLPTIHMNGDPIANLTEPLADLYSALGHAYDFSRQCMPNMRNFYMHADGRERYDAAIARVRSWQERIDR